MSAWIGPTLCRVYREEVDGQLVRILLEPIADEQTVELSGGDQFVTVLSKVPLVPLSVWET
jgi:hypothetical protein